jgi:tetratricopeptide (TPR) repeat protein
LYEQVCAADDTNADAWMKLGIIHGMQDDHDKAAGCLRKSLALNLGSTETRMNYAQALLQSSEHMQAIEQYEQVLDTTPKSETAWFMLGRCRAELDQLDAAMEAYRKALAIKPEYAQALHGLGFALTRLGQNNEAIGYLRHALRLNPNMGHTHFALGNALQKLGNLDEALDHLMKAVTLNRGNPEFQYGLGTALSVTGRQDVAVRHIRRAIQLRPDYIEAQISLAATLVTLGQPDDAYQMIEAVLEKHPDNLEAITLAATMDQHRGNIDKAHERIRPLLDAGKTHINLLLAYATICSKLGESEIAIDLMEQMLEKNPTLTATGRCNLHFSLGDLYDKNKQYRQAFEHYHKGNELKHVEFDPAQHTAGIDAIINTHSTTMMAAMPRAGIRSDRPVFVVGMPRSGTTLVEQILSSHPAIFGAGELPDIIQQVGGLASLQDSTTEYPYNIPTLSQQAIDSAAQDYLDRIAELSPDAERVVDKMPGNFMHLGYIELLFPGARIIHCKRDPLDTCLSNYFQNFSRSLHFSFNLTHLGVFYRNYLRLMEHWRGIITLPMLEVQYEDMIADQESGSRRIVEFCGLEWDENCMDFHKSERYVATASYDQVRKPIYKSSVSRWKNYSDFIGPLRKALG